MTGQATRGDRQREQGRRRADEREGQLPVLGHVQRITDLPFQVGDLERGLGVVGIRLRCLVGEGLHALDERGCGRNPAAQAVEGQLDERVDVGVGAEERRGQRVDRNPVGVAQHVLGVARDADDLQFDEGTVGGEFVGLDRRLKGATDEAHQAQGVTDVEPPLARNAVAQRDLVGGLRVGPPPAQDEVARDHGTDVPFDIDAPEGEGPRVEVVLRHQGQAGQAPGRLDFGQRCDLIPDRLVGSGDRPDQVRETGGIREPVDGGVRAPGTGPRGEHQTARDGGDDTQRDERAPAPAQVAQAVQPSSTHGGGSVQLALDAAAGTRTSSPTTRPSFMRTMRSAASATG